MKRLLAAIFLASSVAGIAGAIPLTIDQNLASTVVTSTTSYTFDMSQGLTKISAQVNVSSTSPTASTFNDGRASTGSLTLTSTSTLKGAGATNTLTVTTNSALQATAGTDTINVTSTNSLSGATITLTAEGNTFVFTQGFQWLIGASTSSTASSIASAINNQRYWTATSAGSTVTITCVTASSRCNSYTLTDSTPTVLTVGSANFTGGLDNPSFQINGQQYIQGIDWTTAAVSSNTAVSIAAAVNSEDVYGITAATTSASVVTLTVTQAGTAGNAFTLTSSTNTALTRGGATFSGGSAHPTVTVGGTTITEGTDWLVAATATGTVVNIANAIGSASTQVSTSTTLNTSSGTATFTSLTVGTNTNYRLATTAASGITLSGGNLTGGSNSAINLADSEITIPGHGLSTGQAVLFSTGSNVAIAPLVTGTTYYIIAEDANDVNVSTTQAQALAGTFITLLSSSTSGPHNFTLTPLNYSGTSVLTWYGSNDNVNFSTVNVATENASTSNMPTSFLWDFGNVNYRYLKLQVAGPTNGGLSLTAILHGTN